MTKQLAIDVGNSSIKTGMFEGDVLVEQKRFTDTKSLRAYVQEITVAHGIIATVGKEVTHLQEEVPEVKNFMVLSHESPVPFENLYETPQTLGLDRVAIAAAAFHCYPEQPVLAIDFGSCITYDFVNEKGQYLGGAISPGLTLRFKSLHNFTARLPLVEFEAAKDAPLIGKNTEQSMISGVVGGTVAEVREKISQYKAAYPDCQVIFSGGDAKYFESKIKEGIFALPELVLVGLNTILIYNVSKR